MCVCGVCVCECACMCVQVCVFVCVLLECFSINILVPTINNHLAYLFICQMLEKSMFVCRTQHCNICSEL